MNAEIEIGHSKRALCAYSFDNIALVPVCRIRDTFEVHVDWRVDVYHMDLPVMASFMDSVMSPETAIMVGRLGGTGMLDLEGLWTHYEDPTETLERIRRADSSRAISILQEIYHALVKPELITERPTQIRASGAVITGRLGPAQAQRRWRTVAETGMDLIVIRGSSVSAEHISGSVEPLNLKRLIYELDVSVIVGRVTTYTAAFHFMRTDAVGVLVGQGSGAPSSVRQILGLRVLMTTAMVDIAGARHDYLDELGSRCIHVIANGSMDNSGDVVKAITCGADAVMSRVVLVRAKGTPGDGYRWGVEARHERLSQGFRNHVGTVGTMAEILNGPFDRAGGALSLVGAPRHIPATIGHVDVKGLQQIEVVLAPYTGSQTNITTADRDFGRWSSATEP